jgi:hypothetical protein
MNETLGYTGPAEALVGYYADRKPRAAMYGWRTTCRLCSGPLSTVLRLADTPPANELLDEPKPQDTFPLALAQCAACEHFQLQTVVDPSRMFGEYHYVSGTSPVFRAHLERLADELALSLSVDDLLVEIGSNDGTLLRAFDGTGVRVLGVDPAKNLADEATASGVLTYPGFFNVKTAKAIVRSAGHAKMIVALNVLAHADGLSEIADAARELLANDGELVLEVAYLPDMLRDGTFDMIYAEHVAFWHLEPMRRFFGQHGLNLYDAEHVDSQGGSIRCFFQKIGREPVCAPWTRRLVEMFDAEKELVSPDAVRGFCQKIDDAKVALGTMLRDMKAQGKRIAAFGCPAKATTLLHHFDIGRETLDYIVEENPLKVGKVSPGKHVPIVGVERMKSDAPDVCVVLAWNFSANIMARHDWFQGDWVVPLPTPTITKGVQ